MDGWRDVVNHVIEGDGTIQCDEGTEIVQEKVVCVRGGSMDED